MPPYKKAKLGGVYEYFKEMDSWVCQININKDDGEEKKICGNIITKGKIRFTESKVTSDPDPYQSQDPDPDPHQNDTDPKHC